MSLTDSIKNKVSSLKESLKAAIFSKNKSIIRISEFSKKSILTKALTFTAVNMFVVIPYFIWFASVGNLLPWLTMIVPTFLFGFFISNALFFGTGKFISSLFSIFKKKESKEVPLIINWNEPQKEQIPAEYFPKGFMNRIREFFIASGSVATSFVPFLFVMNIVLFINSLTHAVTFDLGFGVFSSFFNYLKIDSVLLVLFTTLTLFSIYGVRALRLLKRVLIRALAAQKGKNNTQITTPQSGGESYTPQRSFPVEDFIPSLSSEFRKTHNVQVYEEAKAPIDIKKD